MKAIHSRADTHPWTDEQGYHSVCLESQSEFQLKNIVRTLKNDGWTIWIVGKIQNTEISAAFLFRKS